MVFSPDVPVISRPALHSGLLDMTVTAGRWRCPPGEDCSPARFAWMYFLGVIWIFDSRILPVLCLILRHGLARCDTRTRCDVSCIGEKFREMPMPAGNQRKHNPYGPLHAMHAGLAETIGRWIDSEGDCATAIGSLQLFRRDAPSDACACMVESSVVFVVQGAKQLLVGEQAFAYNTERFLLNSLDVPARSQVLEASPQHPCLGLVFKLNMGVMAEIIAQNSLPPPRECVQESSTTLGSMTPVLLESFTRLLGLLDEPEAIAVLAPLIEREIHYRLLTSDLAARLWQITSVGSHSHRIARAVHWLRRHYAQPMSIEELAAHVQMSASTLHHHFRLLTAMSPLQYQKWLRLNEARRLMLNEGLDASTAAFQVGYESPSQFSREYRRLFGVPPRRDIEGMRDKAQPSRATIFPN
ncbi:AraC family transcriptional regulator [Aquitalea sp. ASV15]|uniref:AraC family transcriptional regulator n=1 Tax=Aquitalea sp. ASV15 TaxID=2795104 RepID=UPI0018EB271E|nr:AraC family transcriptional regulator [Aquitalea sp. ASV15]